jgi:uncharacterized protein with PQ loop repeat
MLKHQSASFVDYGSMVGFSLAYMVWSGVVAYMQHWPYPFQRMMGPIPIIIFNVVAIALACFVLFLKRLLVAKLYGASTTTTKPNKKKTN